MTVFPGTGRRSRLDTKTAPRVNAEGTNSGPEIDLSNTKEKTVGKKEEKREGKSRQYTGPSLIGGGLLGGGGGGGRRGNAHGKKGQIVPGGKIQRK